jgi:transmembrane sensor
MTHSSDLSALRAIRAQAAVWVTDLHGPERSAALESDLRRWLAEDPRHSEAFELATAAWESSGDMAAQLTKEPPLTPLPSLRRPRPRFMRLAGAAALALLLGATFYALKDPALSTDYAEQKTVELADGTQVTLNANSRLVVEYSNRVRQITLNRGEALIDVAKHQSRPFVVIIGTRKIIAVGTSFQVRRETTPQPVFTVTLIEGRVAVEPLDAPNLIPVESAASTTLLAPGQRLRIAGNAPDALDSPSIDKITAWRRGQVILEDASIRDAAAEFNRYGRLRLTIDASVPESIRVGGVFRIGDPESFARAMANAHQLQLLQNKEEIKLIAR